MAGVRALPAVAVVPGTGSDFAAEALAIRSRREGLAFLPTGLLAVRRPFRTVMRVSRTL